jgi:nucleoside-diphosphate-sugar epimerase
MNESISRPHTGQTLLVFGAAGFIAARVCDLLLEAGWRVLGVDNFDPYYSPELKQWRIGRLSRFPGWSFSQCDITSAREMSCLRDAVPPVHAVMHLAAKAGVRASVEHPLQFLENNLLGTARVLELCRALGVKRLVVASSSSVYGAQKSGPFPESANTHLPLSPYAASKKAAEELCYVYHHLYGFHISLLRFFTVYGPAGRPDMAIFRFIRNAIEGKALTVYGDGSQQRDFSYVDDIAAGVIAALQPEGYGIFNLGADHPVSLNCVISAIERIAGRRVTVDRRAAVPGDAPATWADITRAKSVLGWTPRVPLDRGLRQSVEWYLENRQWASLI